MPDRSAPGGAPFEEAGDATRRTRLANERTWLAWWRAGLTSCAVALGAGALVPALSDGPRWPYAVVGSGFALLGAVLFFYGVRRYRHVDEAVSRGEFQRPDERMLWVLAGASIVLAVAVAVVLLAALPQARGGA